MGSGFYDKTIAVMPQAVLVAPIFSCQLVQALPDEGHDRRIHVAVTEDGALDLRQW